MRIQSDLSKHSFKPFYTSISKKAGIPGFEFPSTEDLERVLAGIGMGSPYNNPRITLPVLEYAYEKHLKGLKNGDAIDYEYKKVLFRAPESIQRTHLARLAKEKTSIEKARNEERENKRAWTRTIKST